MRMALPGQVKINTSEAAQIASCTHRPAGTRTPRACKNSMPPATKNGSTSAGCSILAANSSEMHASTQPQAGVRLPRTSRHSGHSAASPKQMGHR